MATVFTKHAELMYVRGRGNFSPPGPLRDDMGACREYVRGDGEEAYRTFCGLICDATVSAAQLHIVIGRAKLDPITPGHTTSKVEHVRLTMRRAEGAKVFADIGASKFPLDGFSIEFEIWEHAPQDSLQETLEKYEKRLRILDFLAPSKDAKP